jgi:anti-sigma B factor antagonist
VAPDLPQFSLDVTPGDAWTTVSVVGEIDLATAGELTAAVRTALDDASVVIDLRGVSFMDSSGVRALDTALREAAARGRELRVTDGLQPGVVQVLEMTGMLEHLPVEAKR